MSAEKLYDIGQHRVRHGSVMDGLNSLFAGSPKAALFYSDPPWGQGNIKYWQTLNARMNPGAAKQEIDYPAFLMKIMELAVHFTTGPVFIEYGVKWKDDVIAYGARAGLQHVAVATPTYNQGLPLHLHLFVTPGFPRPAIGPDYLNALGMTHGLMTVKTAVMPFIRPGEILLDPCCGLGFSARAAMAYGMRFYGNELNEARLAVTRKHLMMGH